MTLKTAHIDLILLAAPISLSGIHLYLLLVSDQPGWVYLRWPGRSPTCSDTR